VAAQPDKLKEVWRKAAFYSSLGFIVPGALLAGAALGWWLDRQLGTAPVLVIVLGCLGVAAGFVEVLRLLTREERRERGVNGSGHSESI